MVSVAPWLMVALGFVTRSESTRTPPALISFWAMERVFVTRAYQSHLSRRWDMAIGVAGSGCAIIWSL